MDWKSKIKEAAELPGKFLANGGHAQQDIPSQHRLLNAAGMFAAWWGLDKIRDIVFGCNQKTEGEYVEIRREDVPAPLRFLHKTIEWDPNSDAPKDQWKKIVFQLFPGVGAGVGAYAGSAYAFERNGRAQIAKSLKGAEHLNLLDADFIAQYSHSTPLRILAGAFGTFSSASGLTFLYGAALNSSFIEANGAKVFTGKLAKGNMGVEKKATALLKTLNKSVDSKGHLSEAWAEKYVKDVLEPWFGHKLDTPELQQQARDKIIALSHQIEEKAQSQVIADTPHDAVVAALEDALGRKGINKTVTETLGLNPKDARLGNANPALRVLADPLKSKKFRDRLEHASSTSNEPAR